MDTEIYKKQFELEETNWWFVIRRRIITKLLRIYCNSTSSRLLDYGCGSGMTLFCLKKSGYSNQIGFDTSDESVRLSKTRGITVTQDWEQIISFGKVDIILLCDVLEHVEQEHDLIEKLYGQLAPGGVILITVPAYQFLWSGEDHVSHHLRRYTSGTLIKRLRKKNVLAEGYFFAIMLPIMFFVIKVKVLFNPKSAYETDMQEFPRWLNGLLIWINSLEYFLIPSVRLPFGASIYAIIKKDNA
ncbi:MAG: methyltransferase domain-containing protein [Gammaproteobacteria bacterium]|jgi:SAM-dependent methyltransferase